METLIIALGRSNLQFEMSIRVESRPKRSPPFLFLSKYRVAYRTVESSRGLHHVSRRALIIQ